MTPYTINDLPALASLTANDYIPVWDSEASGEPTYKIKVSDMIASMVLIASLLKQNDVVNDLTSTATDKPGSANMIRTLNDKITQYSATYDAYGCTAGSKFSITSRVQKSGYLILLSIVATANSAYTNNDVIAVVPDGYLPTRNTVIMSIMVRRGSTILNFAGNGSVHTNGNVYQDFTASSGQSGDVLTIFTAYSIT